MNDSQSPADVFRRAKEELGGLDAVANALGWVDGRAHNLVLFDIELELGAASLKPELQTALLEAVEALKPVLAGVRAREAAFNFFGRLIGDGGTEPPELLPMPPRANVAAPALVPAPVRAPAVTARRASARSASAAARSTLKPKTTVIPPATAAPSSPETVRTIKPFVVIPSSDFKIGLGAALARRFNLTGPLAAPILSMLAQQPFPTFDEDAVKDTFIRDVNRLRNGKTHPLNQKEFAHYVDPVMTALAQQPFFDEWKDSELHLDHFFAISPVEFEDIVVMALEIAHTRMEEEIEFRAKAALARMIQRHRSCATLPGEPEDDEEDTESLLGDAWLDLLFTKVLAASLKADRKGGGAYFPEAEERRDLLRLVRRFPEALKLNANGSFQAPLVAPFSGYVPLSAMADALNLPSTEKSFKTIFADAAFPDIHSLKARLSTLSPVTRDSSTTTAVIDSTVGMAAAALLRSSDKFSPGSEWYLRPQPSGTLTDQPVTILDLRRPEFYELVYSTPALQKGSLLVEWDEGGARGVRRTIVSPQSLITQERRDELMAQHEAQRAARNAARESTRNRAANRAVNKAAGKAG